MIDRKPLFTAPMLEPDDSDEPGIRLHDVARALQIWEAMQQRQGVSVGAAATAFNTTPELIQKAVDRNPWLSLIGTGPLATRVIFQDGE